MAAYRSVVPPDRTVPDLAWTYPRPLRTDLVAFFTEHVDVTLDGVSTVRPVSPWS